LGVASLTGLPSGHDHEFKNVLAITPPSDVSTS
jgi:hypothetical protein